MTSTTFPIQRKPLRDQTVWDDMVGSDGHVQIVLSKDVAENLWYGSMANGFKLDDRIAKFHDPEDDLVTVQWSLSPDRTRVIVYGDVPYTDVELNRLVRELIDLAS